MRKTKKVDAKGIPLRGRLNRGVPVVVQTSNGRECSATICRAYQLHGLKKKYQGPSGLNWNKTSHSHGQRGGRGASAPPTGARTSARPINLSDRDSFPHILRTRVKNTVNLWIATRFHVNHRSHIFPGPNPSLNTSVPILHA